MADRFVERVEAANRDGARSIPGPEAPFPLIEGALREAGLLDPDRAYIARHFPDRNATYRIKDDAWEKVDSKDPEIPLLVEGYDVAAPDMAWFPVRVQTAGGSLERTRKFIVRRGLVPYWPRSVRVVSRGRGGRCRNVVLTRSAFGAYVLVHLPLRSSHNHGPPFGVLTDDEARFYGVAGYVDFGRGPVQMSCAQVQRVVANEAIGLYDQTKRKGRHRVSQWPDYAEIGRLVRLKTGAFTGFHGIVDALDEDRRRLSVLVAIFGRATAVDVDLAQVERL